MPQGTGDTLRCGVDEKLMEDLMTDVGRSRGLRDSGASRCAQRWAAIPPVWVNRQQEGSVFRCLGPLEYSSGWHRGGPHLLPTLSHFAERRLPYAQASLLLALLPTGGRYLEARDDEARQ